MYFRFMLKLQSAFKPDFLVRMKPTFLFYTICVQLILGPLFKGISSNQEECVGTQNFTLRFDGPDYNGTDFVSWHFENVINQREVTLAWVKNGVFEIRADQFKDKLILPQVGKPAIMITDLKVVDSGTYRVVIGAGNTPVIKLKVKDPCLREDMDTLTCVTKIQNSSPITWKEDGKVISGEMGNTINNVCKDGDNGVKNITCQLSGGQTDQLNVTCSKETTVTWPHTTKDNSPVTKDKKPMPADEPSSNTGAIIGGVIGGVAFIGIVVGIFVFLKKRKGSGYHGTKTNIV